MVYSRTSTAALELVAGATRASSWSTGAIQGRAALELVAGGRATAGALELVAGAWSIQGRALLH